MKIQIENEIAKLLGQLSLNFDYKLQPAKVELYVLLLRDLDLNALRQAVFLHLQSGHSFPLPAELRDLAEKSKPKSFSIGSASETANSAP